MTISVPTKIDSLVSTSITDTTPLYEVCGQTTFYTNDLVQFENKKYVAQRNITVEDYDMLKTSYSIGDTVWCSSIDQYHSKNMTCFAKEGEAYKQPSEYDNWDYSADPADWANLWLMVQFYPYQFWFDGLEYNIFPHGDLATITIKSVAPATAIDMEYTIKLVPIITKMTLTHIQEPAFALNPDTGNNYWQPKFIFKDDTGLYIRTNVSDTFEKKHRTDFPIFKTVDKPSDIEGFLYYEDAEQNKPFDGKNYSKVISDSGSMSMTIKVSEACNMFVLGYVMGDSFDYAFKNAGGSVISSGTVNIDGSRDSAGVLSDWYTTIPVYSSGTVPVNGTIELTIHGSHIELGTFMPGAKVEAGMTNLTLTNTYKDFSTFEYDPWGNAEYIERAKVSVYNGTVDILVEDYDRVDRLLTSLGKNVVIMDGSNNTSNGTPDSHNVFASTQKIGRITAEKQNTVVKQNDIGKVANYSFTLEEIT